MTTRRRRPNPADRGAQAATYDALAALLHAAIKNSAKHHPGPVSTRPVAERQRAAAGILMDYHRRGDGSFGRDLNAALSLGRDDG